jgi:hypothetical protein
MMQSLSCRRLARIAALVALLTVAVVPASAYAYTDAGALTETLSVTLDGTGSGTVTSTPAGIDCPTTCAYDFDAGTQVTLKATPATGSTFGGWFSTGSGPGSPPPCTGTGDCTVTMNQAESIRATFSAVMESLSVANADESGPGGTLIISGPGIQVTVTDDQERQVFAAYGATLTVTATPAAGSAFAGWAGDCSGFAACVLAMTKNYLVQGPFATAGKLTVETAGKGQGTVTSTPAGIDCPGVCAAPFAVGFSVMLTATPATGSYFAGWPTSSGCDDSQSTCMFDMTNPDFDVALFRPDHCLVPNVKRLPLVKAVTRLLAYSCRSGKFTHAYSSHVKKGAVISQTPKVDTRLQRGAKVRLVVSRGKHR